MAITLVNFCIVLPLIHQLVIQDFLCFVDVLLEHCTQQSLPSCPCTCIGGACMICHITCRFYLSHVVHCIKSPRTTITMPMLLCINPDRIHVHITNCFKKDDYIFGCFRLWSLILRLNRRLLTSRYTCHMQNHQANVACIEPGVHVQPCLSQRSLVPLLKRMCLLRHSQARRKATSFLTETPPPAIISKVTHTYVNTKQRHTMFINAQLLRPRGRSNWALINIVYI